MNLIFDLDGTLINSKKRMYNLFNDLVIQSNLSFDQYWGYKKKGISHEEILKKNFNYTSSEIKGFMSNWFNLIETKTYISKDKLYPGVDDLLATLIDRSDLFVCTCRQHKEMVYQQLDEMGIKKYFKKILVTEQKLNKATLIQKNIKTSDNNWLIGDTGNDIISGKSLGINTCAISNGFLSKEVLLSYKPDLLLESINELKLIKERLWNF